MKTLALLLISTACLCDAGLTHDNINGTAESYRLCGVRGPSVPEKLVPVGGTEVRSLKFPWMMNIFACWTLKCFGSLISPKVVLTVGRCIADHITDKMKVSGGEWTSDLFDELLPDQERFVTEKSFHPSYRQARSVSKAKFDVVLLVVESPFTPANNIGFICLPLRKRNVIPTSYITVTDVARSHGNQKVMDMNIVDQCQEAIRMDQGRSFKLHDSFGCAAGLSFNDNETTLWGTPFMYIVEGHYYTGGFSSWLLPSKTAQANNMEIYVDIIKVKSWINRIMKAKGFGTASYTHSTDEK